MNDTIIVTLNNDPSLDGTVRNKLMNELTGLWCGQHQRDQAELWYRLSRC